MAIRYLDEQPVQSGKIRYLDEQPIQGGITKVQKPNQLLDIAKGFGSGVSKFGGDIGSLVNTLGLNPVHNISEAQKLFTGQDIDYSKPVISQLNEWGDYKPETTLGGVAKFGGELAPALLLPEAKLASMGVKLAPKAAKLLDMMATGAYQGGLIGGGEAAGADKNIDDILKSILGGAAIGGTAGGVMRGAGAAFEKAMPSVSQLMSGIPKKDYLRAMESVKGGNSIFTGKYEPIEQYQQLGNKVQESINALKQQEGQKVGEQITALRENIPQTGLDKYIYDTNKIFENPNNIEARANFLEYINNLGSEIKPDEYKALSEYGYGLGFGNAPKEISPKLMGTGDVSNLINDLLASKNYGGIESLSKPDMRAIESISNVLKSHEDILTPEQIYGLKKAIQNKYQNFDINKVKLTSSEGDYIINNITKELNSKLGKEFPDYASASADYADIMDLQSKLGGKLKDQNIANALRNINTESSQTAGFPELFQQLNDLSPQDLKFMNALQDTQTRGQFERWLPHWNDLRIGGMGLGIGASALTHNPAMLIPGSLASPQIEKLLLQLYGSGSRGISPFIEQQAPRAITTGMNYE